MMSKKADKLGKTLETGISEYLGKPFSLDDYTAGDKEGNTYKVIGTIKRYATRVKIEVEVDKATLEPRY